MDTCVLKLHGPATMLWSFILHLSPLPPRRFNGTVASGATMKIAPLRCGRRCVATPVGKPSV
jgi:hypothetical protein